MGLSVADAELSLQERRATYATGATRHVFKIASKQRVCFATQP
jgi:hypothetical protein